VAPGEGKIGAPPAIPLRVVHVEARACEVTPSPDGQRINLLITGPGGVRMEFGFEIDLGRKLRDETQQSLAQLGHIRAALRSITPNTPTPQHPISSPHA